MNRTARCAPVKCATLTALVPLPGAAGETFSSSKIPTRKEACGIVSPRRVALRHGEVATKRFNERAAGKGKGMARETMDEVARFRELFLSFRIDAVDGEVTRLLGCGIAARSLLEACRACMNEIGKKFEQGEYYLPELVVAGEMFKTVSGRIRPLLQSDSLRGVGTIVLGTPRGDIHNLGKDIFGVLAEASGFTVYDLGVDVAPDAFVRKVEETGAEVLGMSALITAAFKPMEEVVRKLEQGGLRDRVRVVIGGGVTTRDMARRMGVDGQTQDAYEGLKLVRSFLRKKGDRRTSA